LPLSYSSVPSERTFGKQGKIKDGKKRGGGRGRGERNEECADHCVGSSIPSSQALHKRKEYWGKGERKGEEKKREKEIRYKVSQPFLCTILFGENRSGAKRNGREGEENRDRILGLTSLTR